MAFIKIVALCVGGALICAVLRVQKPEFAFAVALATGLCAFYMLLDGINEGVEALGSLALRSEDGALLARAAGVALIAEFGAQLCRDAGEGALAGRIELGGRVALLGIALPLLTSLASTLGELLP